MAYFSVDGEGHREYATLAEAVDDAEESINVARENCDPEWPMDTGDIAVFEAESGCEYPSEDGKLLFQAAEVNVREADEGSGCDYFCDYELREAKMP